jgi:hypothetical protein
MNLEALQNEIETALRTGQRDLARSGLLKIKKVALPRSKAGKFATLARRAGLLNIALQIMMPIVRPKTKPDTGATAEEIATYALILLGFGAIQECSAILETADQSNSEVLMAQAFTAIKTWDYGKATLFLNKFIASNLSNDYLRTVAEVNLAASKIALGGKEHLDAGRRLLDELLEKTAREGWTLLQSNARELSIQLAIQEGDWLACDNFLGKMNGPAAGDESHEPLLFQRKWRAIAEVLRSNRNTDGLSQLKKVRQQASELGHWETVRDCDFHEAIATKNRDLALRVYFGTPFPTYRKRLRDSTRGWLEIPDTYRFQPQPIEKLDDSRVFQLSSGREVANPAVALPAGKSLHLALQILLSDFYRPFLVGSLFSEVFKTEYFNPASSPRRVAFLIHRLRNWFEENNIPFDISSDRDGYRILSIAPYSIEISSRTVANADSNHIQLARLQSHFKKLNQTDLGAREIASTLEISERSARYFLQWALENGHLIRTGAGRKIRYTL